MCAIEIYVAVTATATATADALLAGTRENDSFESSERNNGVSLSCILCMERALSKVIIVRVKNFLWIRHFMSKYYMLCVRVIKVDCYFQWKTKTKQPNEMPIHVFFSFSLSSDFYRRLCRWMNVMRMCLYISVIIYISFTHLFQVHFMSVLTSHISIFLILYTEI